MLHAEYKKWHKVSTVVYQIVLLTYIQWIGCSILPSAYAPRPGMLSTIFLDPGVVNGSLVGIC